MLDINHRSLIPDATTRKGSHDSIYVIVAIVIGLLFVAAVVGSVVPLMEDGFSTIFSLSGEDVG